MYGMTESVPLAWGRLDGDQVWLTGLVLVSGKHREPGQDIHIFESEVSTLLDVHGSKEPLTVRVPIAVTHHK